MPRLTYDLHLHSCLSPCGDDDMTPANMVGMAKIVGLDLIALTDHNSCKNSAAFATAAEFYGVHVIHGMELTTSEEVHVLCYFASLDHALAFDEYVYAHIPDIPNNPAFFGNQLIKNEEDVTLGTLDKLLISATDINLDEVYDLVQDYRGIMVPAHINKSTTSILSNLGFIPFDSQFRCVEVKNPDDWPMLCEQHAYLKNCNMISSSDAHDFNSIHEPIHFLDCASTDPADIIQALQKK